MHNSMRAQAMLEEESMRRPSTGPAVFLLLSKGLQSQCCYSLWYRSRDGTDFDMSEIASPSVCASHPPWSSGL